MQNGLLALDYYRVNMLRKMYIQLLCEYLELHTRLQNKAFYKFIYIVLCAETMVLNVMT